MCLCVLVVGVSIVCVIIGMQDLAEGHVSALEYLKNHGPSTYVFNLGSGRGYSVLEMIAAMKRAAGKDVAYVIGPRREGDVAVCYADPTKATRELGWHTKLGLDEMCRDLYSWQVNNPNGYRGATEAA